MSMEHEEMDELASALAKAVTKIDDSGESKQ